MKTKNWPEGVQCGVALTFDLDAETFWFSRTMDSMASPNLMAEGAYGPKVAVPRILDMLDRLELKATFFIPGWVIEHHTETCREIVRRGHEIGYHGYLHEKAYFVEQENELIAKAKKIMKDLLGVEPVGHRTPEAELTKETIRTIIDNGFEYSTNTMDRDCPYLHELEDGRKIVELPFNWLYDDSSHFFFTPQTPERRRICAPSTVYEIWRTEFDGLYEEGGLYPFVLHPQIIGRVSRVKMLEDLLTYMKSRPGTLIGPGKVIADAARKALMPEA